MTLTRYTNIASSSINARAACARARAIAHPRRRVSTAGRARRLNALRPVVLLAMEGWHRARLLIAGLLPWKAQRAAESETSERGGLEGELSRTRNRLLTLEADFATIQKERSKLDELRASIANSFSWRGKHYPQAGTLSLAIQAPKFAPLCASSPQVASIFSVDLVAGMDASSNNSGHVASRSLIAGCPGGANGGNFTSEVPLSCGKNMHICVGLDLFNVHLDDLGRSRQVLDFSSRKPVLARTVGRTCSRFSIHVDRRLGCQPCASREDKVDEPKIARRSPCSFTGETGGQWVDPEALLSAKKRGVYRPLCTPPKPTTLPHGTWIHVVGDSVTASLMIHLVKSVLRHKSPTLWRKTSPPKVRDYLATCFKGVCISMMSWFDLGVSTSPAEFSVPSYLPKELIDHMRVKYKLNATAPNVTVVTMGSHHRNVWGYDEAARQRFNFTFGTFLKSAMRDQTSKIVLMLETARDMAKTAYRFAHPSEQCLLSNLRWQRRNVLMAEILQTRCREAGMQCRVLDLFSPTNTLVGAPPGVFFRDRDPVHVLRDKHVQLAFTGPLLMDVIHSFDWT
jgi:hypothetical protein